MRTKNQTLAILKANGYDPSLIIDVGVATGTEGLYDIWPDVKYIFIEGLPKFYDDVQKLAASLTDGLFVPAFAGAKPDTIAIATDPNHVHSFTSAGEAPSEWVRSEIEVVTVDSVVERVLPLQNDLRIILKIDVDGFEIPVLHGCERVLQTDCTVIIEAALLDEERSRFGQITSFLVDRGFEVFDIIEPLLREKDNFLWQVDLVFTRRTSFLRSCRHYSQ